MAVVPRSPSASRRTQRHAGSPEFAATPENLVCKAVSPGPKTDPLDRVANPAPIRQAESIVATRGELRAFLAHKSDAEVLDDECLRRIFNYDMVYAVLGSTKQTMENAVYSLFSLLFKNFGQPSQFGPRQAYRYYDKFPVESCTTVLSSARYNTISDKLRVDPHFLRFACVLTMKMLLPRDWCMEFDSGLRQGAKESVMMLGGTNMKKSTILKMLRRVLRNSQDNTTSPGVDEELTRLGFKRRVSAKRNGHQNPNEEGHGDSQNADDPGFVEEDQLFWYFFNPRMTYEGLIDHWSSDREPLPEASSIGV